MKVFPSFWITAVAMLGACDHPDVDSSRTTQRTLHGDVILVERYNWRGAYLRLERRGLENDLHIVQSDRCPVEDTSREKPRCIPTAIGFYALEKYSKYIAKPRAEEASKAQFLAIAEWFKDNQDDRGGWVFDYAENWQPARAATLGPGWYSGAAQGLAISTMVRAFNLTGDVDYLAIARRAVDVLRTPVEDGGVLRCALGHSFYEEYPTAPMSNVLSGYLFAVVGLYDLSEATGDAIYRDYFVEGVDTVRATISLYDLGALSASDLSHLQHPGEPPNPADWDEHALHVTQLSWLRFVTGDATFFTPLIQRWVGYMNDVPVAEN